MTKFLKEGFFTYFHLKTKSLSNFLNDIILSEGADISLSTVKTYWIKSRDAFRTLPNI